MKFIYSVCALFLSVQSGQALAQQDVGRIYANNCASCHGQNLEGGLGPSLIDDEWKHGNSDKAILEVIKEGVPQAGMPAWKRSLSDKDMRGLVVFMREKAYQAQQSDALAQDDKGLFKTQDYTLELEELADFSSPIWGITFLPNGDMLATEKKGKLWLVQQSDENSDYKLTEIKGIPEVWYRSQAGLLDVAVHPNYPRQPWVYISYSEPTSAKGKNQEGGMTAIARGQIINGEWKNHEQIYSADIQFHSRSGVHFGSRIVLHNGYVYFSIGERGQMELAQDLSKPNGKIHRLYYDGRIPQNNPFVKTEGALASIWSYGHRNPQGLVLNPVTEEIWETEHGPRGGDEVNLIEKGKNYGWPVITYGINYNGEPITDKTEQAGMEQPKHFWVPSIATGGIEFYRGKKFAKWQNNLLATGMAKQELHRLVIKDNQVIEDEVVIKGQGRIRDVAVSPSGEIVIALNAKSGQIVRIKPVK